MGEVGRELGYILCETCDYGMAARNRVPTYESATVRGNTEFDGRRAGRAAWCKIIGRKEEESGRGEKSLHSMVSHRINAKLLTACP